MLPWRTGKLPAKLLNHGASLEQAPPGVGHDHIPHNDKCKYTTHSTTGTAAPATYIASLAAILVRKAADPGLSALRLNASARKRPRKPSTAPSGARTLTSSLITVAAWLKPPFKPSTIPAISSGCNSQKALAATTTANPPKNATTRPTSGAFFPGGVERHSAQTISDARNNTSALSVSWKNPSWPMGKWRCQKANLASDSDWTVGCDAIVNAASNNRYGSRSSALAASPRR